jgi:hypothetical protein
MFVLAKKLELYYKIPGRVLRELHYPTSLL